MEGTAIKEGKKTASTLLNVTTVMKEGFFSLNTFVTSQTAQGI